jgi:hypothetical protein
MESLILAAQGQTINSNYHQRNIMRQQVGSKCRMCCKADEHTKHIVVGCTTLAPAEYTNRHNKVGGYIHWMVMLPERVINVNGTTIRWDILVIT